MIKAVLLGGKLDGEVFEVEASCGSIRFPTLAPYDSAADMKQDAFSASFSWIEYKISHYSEDGTRVFMVPL